MTPTAQGFPAWLLDPPKLRTRNRPRPRASDESAQSIIPTTPTTSNGPSLPGSPIRGSDGSPISTLKRTESSPPGLQSDTVDDHDYGLHYTHQDGPLVDYPWLLKQHQSRAARQTKVLEERPVPPSLTARQLALINKLEQHFNAPGFSLPAAKRSQHSTPLSERELMWLSRECFIRFLTDNNVKSAISRMERALIWRRTHRMDDVEELAQDLDKDIRTGKSVILGFTPQNWPVLYTFSNRNTIPWKDDRALHYMFMLDRGIDLMADGVTKMVFIFSFKGEKLRPGPPLPIHVMRDILVPFGEYYPETAGLVVVQDLPWWARTFITIIWPFVDQRTRRFVRFLRTRDIPLQPELSADHLLAICGGDLELPWDYDSYWPTFIKTILERREEHLRRWRAIGPPRAGYEERIWKVALPTAIKIKAELGLLDD